MKSNVLSRPSQNDRVTRFTFALILFLHLVERENGADVHTVQNGQQDLCQPQQVAEVVKAKIDQVPGEVHHLAVEHRGEEGKQVNVWQNLCQKAILNVHKTSKVSLFFSLSANGKLWQTTSLR